MMGDYQDDLQRSVSSGSRQADDDSCVIRAISGLKNDFIQSKYTTSLVSKASSRSINVNSHGLAEEYYN